MYKRLIKTSIFVCAFLVGLNAWFYSLQPGMLFYPYRELDALPSDWGLTYKNVELETQDNVRLHGWFVPAHNAKQVVLFFHGNGGNISHRGDSLKIFNRLGLSVFIVDYRGYGQSEGEPGEKGMYLDAMSAWQYLLERGYQAREIIIFGRSMGGAVATQLATRVKPAALILESTFSSARDMTNRMMPVMSRLMYLRFSLNTAKRIKGVAVPLLVMHSPGDEVVPYDLGVKVFNAANAPKYFYGLSGGHNEGFMESMPGYQQMLGTFIDREVLKKSGN